MQSVNLAIIEPSQLFREGLRQLLSRPPYVVCQSATTVSDVLGTGQEPPELLLWGPGAGPIEAEMHYVTTHCSEHNKPHLVLLASSSDAQWIRSVATLGFDAVLMQNISAEILLRSLDLVMLGQQLFPALLARALLETTRQVQAELIPFPVVAHARLPAATRDLQSEIILSGREGQILRYLVEGASNKAIARELRVTEITVKAHVKGLLRKIRATNRTQAAIWALSHESQVAAAAAQVVSLPRGVADQRVAGY